MKVIDAHLHFSNIKRFVNTARTISCVDYSSEGLKKEFAKANVSVGVAMGVVEMHDKAFPDAHSENPMGINLEENIPAQLKYCIGINPFSIKKRDIARLENELKKSSVVGIKLYPGYYPFNILDSVYTSVYELAEEYQMPVVIHMGDTFSYRGYLEFAHPLTVNQLAANFKDVNFVIAHFGNPWVIDTAVVLSNNTNVFTDLSGLIVGDKSKINGLSRNQLFIDNIRRGLVYEEFYNKVMFGSDWPLVPIKNYIEFIKLLIPERYYEDVFWKTAQRVFKKLDV